MVWIRNIWAEYFKRIMFEKSTTTQREQNVIAEALEGTDQQTRYLMKTVFITRSKSMRQAAQDAGIPFKTAVGKSFAFQENLAIRLGLLEEI